MFLLLGHEKELVFPITDKFEIYRPVNITIKFLFLLKLEVVFIIINITIPPTIILLVRQRVSDTLLIFRF